jgi:predicted DCC family thiol-disulfide oxidoreductase YuxK
MSSLPHRLILYDGDCGFCDRSVQWLLEHDREQRFCFAPLQGETAAALRGRHASIPEDLDTMVLVRTEDDTEEVLLRSAAVFGVASELPGIWSFMGWLRVFPSGLMDWLYRAIAAVRYRIFARKDSCRLVTQEEAHRFLS